MNTSKFIKIQTNKFSSAIEIFIAFVVTPIKIVEFFCNLGGYDKDFFGKKNSEIENK